jgi:hypothetical protein
VVYFTFYIFSGGSVLFAAIESENEADIKAGKKEDPSFDAKN